MSSFFGKVKNFTCEFKHSKIELEAVILLPGGNIETMIFKDVNYEKFIDAVANENVNFIRHEKSLLFLD